MSNNNCDYIKNKFSDKKYNIINFSAARTLNGNRDKRKKEDNEILIMNYSIS